MNTVCVCAQRMCRGIPDDRTVLSGTNKLFSFPDDSLFSLPVSQLFHSCLNITVISKRDIYLNFANFNSLTCLTDLSKINIK